MGFLTKFLYLNTGILAGGTAFTVWQYPELRENPSQLTNAMFRGIRCARAGSGMAYDYLSTE